MKKLLYLIPFLLLFNFVSCANNKNITSDEINNTKKSEIKNYELVITPESDVYDVYEELHSPNSKGLKLSPDLKNKPSSALEYHWTLESISEVEVFHNNEGGSKEIINSGDPVYFRLNSYIDYAKPNELAYEVKIKLVVTEKESDIEVGNAELILENYSGMYKVKN